RQTRPGSERGCLTLLRGAVNTQSIGACHTLPTLPSLFYCRRAEQSYRAFIRIGPRAITHAEVMMADQETFVQRNQHRIYVQHHPGAVPALVLMHGFPDNVHLYDRLSPYPSPPRRVVLFDFLGWGSSDKPFGYPYTTDNQVGALNAVITHLGLGQVILVAH